MLHRLKDRQRNARSTHPMSWIFGLLLTLALAGCFPTDSTSSPDSFLVGGTVSGLTGRLTLVLNDRETITLTRDGAYSFSGFKLKEGERYSVTIGAEPADQTCTLSNTSGTVASGDIVNVNVQCQTVALFPIGGTINDLNGTVTLTLNGAQETEFGFQPIGRRVELGQDGKFSFDEGLKDGASYEVAISKQPLAQECDLSNGTGQVANAAVESVSLSCQDVDIFRLGGSLSGLNANASIKFALFVNGASEAADTQVLSANRNFQFSARLKRNDQYRVDIIDQPTNQSCTFQNSGGGEGTMEEEDVLGLAIKCENIYTLGGTVNGLKANETVTLALRKNSETSSPIENPELTENAKYQFDTPFKQGDTYSVVIPSGGQPATQSCTVANQSGSVGTSNVDNIDVNCVDTYAVEVDVSNLTNTLQLELTTAGTSIVGGILDVSNNGISAFEARLKADVAYELSVKQQPSAQRCAVDETNAEGTMGTADITVEVTCIDPEAFGGTLSNALEGELQLQVTATAADGTALTPETKTLNDGDSGAFSFATHLYPGDSYQVSFLRVPLTQRCAFGDGTEAVSGTVPASGGVSLTVDCTALDDFALNLNYSGIKTFHFSWPVLQGDTFYRLLEKANNAAGFVVVQDNIPAGTGDYAHIVPLYARVNAQYILERCQPQATSPEECPDSNTVTVQNGNPRNTLRTSIGYFKADFPENKDWFEGTIASRRNNLSISDDGRLLAVGAPREDDNRQGIKASGSSNNGRPDSGAVYLYRYTDDTGWQLDAFIKANDAQADDWFGFSVSLSGDGAYLAVGAVNYKNQPTKGKVYLYHHNVSGWQRQRNLETNTANAGYGSAVALDGDGSTLAVGSEGQGRVLVYERGNSDSWENANSTAVSFSDPELSRDFGSAVSLNKAGDVLAVGAPNNDGEGGRAYVYHKQGDGNWAVDEALNERKAGGRFGATVSLDDAGKALAVGDPFADPASKENAGLVHIYRVNASGNWGSGIAIEAPNAEARDIFGHASLSGDGKRLAVGAGGFLSGETLVLGEASNGQGINSGQQNDNTLLSSGAAYTYVFDGSSWQLEAYIKAPNTDSGDGFGMILVLSGDGDTLAVLAPGEDSKATGPGTITGRNDDKGTDTSAVYLY